MGAAVVGAVGGAYSAHENKVAAQGAGKTNWNSSSTPWGPTDMPRQLGTGAASDYMKAYQDANNQWDYYSQFPSGAAQQTVFATGQRGGGGGGRGGSSAPSGGGGAGSGGSSGSGGLTGRQIASQGANAMLGLAQGGSPYYQPAQDLATSMMSGTNNPYRDQAAGLAAGMGQEGNNQYLDAAGNVAAGFGQSNPYLVAYLNAHSGQYGGGPGGGGGTGGAYSFYGGAPVTGAGGQTDPTGAAAVLREKIHGDPYAAVNPALQKVIDDSTRNTRDQYLKATVPGLTSAFTGAGRYGSLAYADAQAQAANTLQQNLGAQVNQLEYQGYQQADQDYQANLATAAGYDTAANQTRAQQQSASAASGASAAAASAQQALAQQQMYLQAVNEYGQDQSTGLSGLMGAAGLQNQAQVAGQQGILSAANMFSNDQQSALGLTPALSMMDMNRWNAAYGAGQGIDQLAVQQQLGQGQISLGRGQLSLANNQAAFNQQQALMMQPFAMLGAAGGIYNTMGGAYGQQSGYGQQPYNAGPGAVQGALGGAATGLGLYGMYNGMLAQQPAPAAGPIPQPSPAYNSIYGEYS